ncbi:MAG: flagellar basal body L-ring protein FlgH [Oligoflexia bacterium]|nr:flagellar basal body L-ring protein FlgH [Oligoflexia bacterium]
MKATVNLAILSLVLSSCSSTLQSFKRHVGGEPEKIRVASNKASTNAQGEDGALNYQEEEIKFDDSYVSSRPAHNPLNRSQTDDASLWDGSSQQSFLFSRNLQKKVGDLVTIKLEDTTKAQLLDEYKSEYSSISTKSKRKKYVKRLMGGKKEFSRSEVRRMLAKSASFSEKLTKKQKAPKSSKKRILSSDEITARVVQVMPNSSYKIQGVQSLLIKKKPYKMLLSGLIKSSDIGPDDSVVSSRMIDKKVKFIKIGN